MTIFIIVPEQSNLTSEKKFFDITGRDYLFNTDVDELSPTTRLKISEDLRREMIEIFSGTNIY